MDPTLALDWQRDQLEFTSSSLGLKYYRALVGARETAEEFAKRYSGDSVDREGAKLNGIVQTTMAAGETFAVDEEMMDLLVYAADSLPDDVVHRWSPPSPIGFVMLPRSETYGGVLFDVDTDRRKPVTGRRTNSRSVTSPGRRR